MCQQTFHENQLIVVRALLYFSLFLLYFEFLNKVLPTLLPYLDMHTKIRLETDLIKLKQFLG